MENHDRRLIRHRGVRLAPLRLVWRRHGVKLDDVLLLLGSGAGGRACGSQFGVFVLFRFSDSGG